MILNMFSKRSEYRRSQYIFHV